MYHSWLREGCLKWSQEVLLGCAKSDIIVKQAEADCREYQPESAAILLDIFRGVLFDFAECRDDLLLAQIDEHLHLSNAKSILFLKLLLDSFCSFLGCAIFYICSTSGIILILSNVLILNPLRKTLEFLLNKDVRFQEADQVVHIEKPERSHCLCLYDLKIDIVASQ